MQKSNKWNSSAELYQLFYFHLFTIHDLLHVFWAASGGIGPVNVQQQPNLLGGTREGDNKQLDHMIWHDLEPSGLEASFPNSWKRNGRIPNFAPLWPYLQFGAYMSVTLVDILDIVKSGI